MNTMISICFVGLAFGFVLCLARAVRGPTAFDRVLAFDSMVLQALGMLLVYSILERTSAYFDLMLVVALLGFVGTVSIARYLEGDPDD